MADGAAPFGVTAGPRGEYVSLNTSIGRFDHQGNLTTIPIPSDHPRAGWLTSDPSGAVWISERDSGKIGRLSPNGSIVEFQLPRPGRHPAGERDHARRILYVTDQGEQYDRPARSSDGSHDLVPGPDARRDALRPDARFRRCVVVHGTQRRPDRPHDPGWRLSRVVADSGLVPQPDRHGLGWGRLVHRAIRRKDRPDVDERHAHRIPDRRRAGRDHGRPRRPAVRRPRLREAGRPA